MDTLFVAVWLLVVFVIGVVSAVLLLTIRTTSEGFYGCEHVKRQHRVPVAPHGILGELAELGSDTARPELREACRSREKTQPSLTQNDAEVTSILETQTDHNTTT